MLTTVRLVCYASAALCCAAALAGCSSRIRLPEEPPATVRQGDEYFRIERYDDAINKYRLFLDETSQSAYTPRVFYKTALAEYRLGRYKDTLATLEVLDERYPRMHWVQVDALRGDALRALGKRLAALESWDSGWGHANQADRDKLSRRIVAVANELTDAELKKARDRVRTKDVTYLIDEQIASRQSPALGEPVPESSDEKPGVIGAKTTHAAAPEGESPSEEPPEVVAPVAEAPTPSRPSSGFGPAAAPRHPAEPKTSLKPMAVPPVETGPADTSSDDSPASSAPTNPPPEALMQQPDTSSWLHRDTPRPTSDGKIQEVGGTNAN